MKDIKSVMYLGIVFTIIVGCLLHFTYEWSGRNSFVALFSAVNESTWEHLKLLFFPYLMFTVFEYFYYGNDSPNFITAKCIGVICGLILIPILFYTYTTILGTNYFIFDISIFILSVIISYVISYRILMNPALEMNFICLFLLICITLAFFKYTFYLPEEKPPGI